MFMLFVLLHFFVVVHIPQIWQHHHFAVWHEEHVFIIIFAFRVVFLCHTICSTYIIIIYLFKLFLFFIPAFLCIHDSRMVNVWTFGLVSKRWNFLFFVRPNYNFQRNEFSYRLIFRILEPLYCLLPRQILISWMLVLFHH